MNNENTQEVQPEITEQELELELEAEPTTEEAPKVEPDWKAEALKYKGIAQRLYKKEKKVEPQPAEKKQVLSKEDGDIRLTVKELQLAEQKRQFGYEHNLSPEETDAVFKISPNPTKDVLEDPFVKGGLASLRAKKRVSDNTPSSSTRSATFNLDSKDTSTQARQKALDEFRIKRFGQ